MATNSKYIDGELKITEEQYFILCRVANEIFKKKVSVDPEIVKLVNKNFWDLI